MRSINASIKNSDMNLEQWKSMGKWKEIKGLNIFYQRHGKGPNLLLLHAYPTASWGWHKLWDDLTRNFNVLAPDLPGSGFSDKPRRYEYSILSLANVIQSLIRSVSHEPFHILSHAYGCSIAQELLQRHADEKVQLQSVYFINGGIFPEYAHTTPMQRFLTSLPGELLVKSFPTPFNSFRKNFSKTFSPDHHPTGSEMLDYWELLTYNKGHKRVPRVIQYIKERKLFRDRWVEAMQKVDIPLGLFLSVKDPLIDERMGKSWKQMFPHSAYYATEEPSGHYPPLEIPETVLEAYLQFYQSNFDLEAV